MAIPKGYIDNFEQLKKAFKYGDAAIMEVRELATGVERIALVAIHKDSRTKEFCITPFAIMIDGDPYEMFAPPDGKGGYSGAVVKPVGPTRRKIIGS